MPSVMIDNIYQMQQARMFYLIEPLYNNSAEWGHYPHFSEAQEAALALGQSTTVSNEKEG